MKKLVTAILLFTSTAFAAGPLSDPNVAALIRDIALLTTSLGTYQPVLVSGSNIKTLNGLSLLGSGNLTIAVPATQHPVSNKWFNGYSSGSFSISRPVYANISGINAVMQGGTGTSMVFTQGSVVYAGASGIYTQDANNFYYNPTGGPGSSPTLQIGPRASNPIDAEYEFYTATTGINVAHFHNTGVQSSTGGAIISLNAVPIGASISSGSRLGSFQFGGSQDTSQTLGVGATIGSVATENWSGSAHGSTIDFKTIPNGSTTRTTALTLNQDQSATFTNTVNATTFTGALTGTASGNLVAGGVLGTPSSGTLTNCTFPTLNQNTTGSAAKLTTGRTIGMTGPITWTTPSFDGSGNVTAAATVTAQTGTGSIFAMQTSPNFVTPVLGVATGTNLHNTDTTNSYQFLADGGASQGGGIEFVNSISGSTRRNWQITSEFSVAGDLAIAHSASAGGTPNVLSVDITSTGTTFTGAVSVGSGSNTVYRCTGATNLGMLTTNSALCVTGYATTSLSVN